MLGLSLKKSKKGRLRRFNYKNSRLKFGLLGLKALESGFITKKQIDFIKQNLFKTTKHKLKLWLSANHCLKLTKKPVGVRMGKGSGKTLHSVYKIKRGTVILELTGFNIKVLVNRLNSFKQKLPLKTKLVF